MAGFMGLKTIVSSRLLIIHGNRIELIEIIFHVNR